MAIKKRLTLDEAISSIGTGTTQYILLFLVAGGYLAMSSELLLSVFSVDAIHSLWSIDHETFSWLPFCTSTVAVVGGLLVGSLSDKKGRRVLFVVWIGLSAAFSLASAFAPNFITFIVLR